MWVPTTVRRRVGQGYDATERRSNRRRALTKDISFEPATGAINDRLDDAYRAKYKSSAYLQRMIDTPARSATVKIVLAGVKRKFSQCVVIKSVRYPRVKPKNWVECKCTPALLPRVPTGSCISTSAKSPSHSMSRDSVSNKVARFRGMVILRRLVCSAAMRIATQFALILLASNLAAHGQHFRQVTISTGPSPRWIAVAEHYGDGAGVGTLRTGVGDDHVRIAIMIDVGDGRGGFHPAPGSPLPAGHLPNDVAIGDMNNDGNLDLVVANHQSPYLLVFLGDGRGGFHLAPRSPVDVHSDPHESRPRLWLRVFVSQ
jgi:hypothetical protein